MPQIPELEIFRAGSYPQGTFTVDDLLKIAAAYDPAFHEAPCCLTHEADPSENLSARAYGWVRRLWVRDQSLFASIDDVPADFAAALAAGEFKKRSAALYTALPLPDGSVGPYLRHVAWVAVPQVKGLADLDPSTVRRTTFRDQSSLCLLTLPGSALLSSTPTAARREGGAPAEPHAGFHRSDEHQPLSSFPSSAWEREAAKLRFARFDGEPGPSNPFILLPHSLFQEKPQMPDQPTVPDPAPVPPDPQPPAEGADAAPPAQALPSTQSRPDFPVFFSEMIRLGKLTPAQADVEHNLLARLAGATEFNELDAALVDAKLREIRARPAVDLASELGPRGLSRTATPDDPVRRRVRAEFAEHRELFRRLGVTEDALLALEQIE